MCPRAE